MLAPVGAQPVWAAGVTFRRSRDARLEESRGLDAYDKVYLADRPELFLKALPGTARGPGQPIGVRADSDWDVPEPELAVVADRRGEIVAYTIGDDVSSRSIEGENPLYLPQAKLYAGSCALGPCLVPVGEAARPGRHGDRPVHRAGRGRAVRRPLLGGRHEAEPARAGRLALARPGPAAGGGAAHRHLDRPAARADPAAPATG